jgi:hypothetical protein
MGLYDRFIGSVDEGANQIPVHDFIAALGEIQRGQMTKAQAVDTFGLDAQEQVEAQAIIDKMNVSGPSGLTRVELHDVLLLTGSRIPPYDTEANVKARLGF